ncbi:hypothetical protein [Rhodoblastus sp.]|uniref:hypothetical protein n=1 Tax=Rhodoblastus sp. TaxID=1962975 RepID=UPI0025CFA264|nr:hypothetical protein [Rhodoblastus sp.]
MTQEMSSADPASATMSRCEGHDAVVGLLLDALRKLADAGEVDPACRIAGTACVILRRCAPAAEHRFNALLHRLSRRLQKVD